MKDLWDSSDREGGYGGWVAVRDAWEFSDAPEEIVIVRVVDLFNSNFMDSGSDF